MFKSKPALPALLCVCALLMAPDVLARGIVIDPDGVSFWDQFVAWLAGVGNGANHAGNTLDPWG